MISYSEAYALTLGAIHPLGSETVALLAATGRTAAEDLPARVDSPSVDVSLKDGYAIQGADVRLARPDAPVALRLLGSVAAGGDWQGCVHAGEAVRILSGAPLPVGADAILSEEFTQVQGTTVLGTNHAEPGRNILRRGSDVRLGERLVAAGERLSPSVIGLLAAAGYTDVPVVQRPRVAILSTGDEILAPGQPLTAGKLYASNLYTLAAWCLHFGFTVETRVAPDDEDRIRAALAECLERSDAVLTSGGAWKGEHDLTVGILDEMGWRKIYHRVRIGPGKAVGFGMFQEKPVFCLPGGPPSNHMAFIQLALPGLQRLGGYSRPGLRKTPAILAETISGQSDWTQFVHGRITQEDDSNPVFQPLVQSSRLQKLAQTNAVAIIPEGIAELPAGSTVMVQALTGDQS